MTMKRFIAASLLLGLFASISLAKDFEPAIPVPMPGGGTGIGFDDLGFAPGLKKVMAPGGRTGKIFLVDPATRKVTSMGGFTAETDYKGGHGEGAHCAAADESGGAWVCDPDHGRLLFFRDSGETGD